MDVTGGPGSFANFSTSTLTGGTYWAIDGGAGQPRRDLFLSPDHAVFDGGVLIPIKHLINGATIVQADAAEVHYFQIELTCHDVLLAEGLPCESYLDTGNRAAFVNGGPCMQLHADFMPLSWEDACAPLCENANPVVALRRRLLARARRQGHRQVEGPAPYLLVQGRQVRPARIVGPLYRFLLPANVGSAVLASHSGIPAGFDPRRKDMRRLGVALAGIVVDGNPLPIDHRSLRGGFYPPESLAGARWRWTDGAGEIALPRYRHGPFVVDLLLTRVMHTWNSPVLSSAPPPRTRARTRR